MESCITARSEKGSVTMTLYEFFKEEADIMGKYANGELIEVVFCKDCKKQSNFVCNYLEGLCALQSVKPNDYCSYGERKER